MRNTAADLLVLMQADLVSKLEIMPAHADAIAAWQNALQRKVELRAYRDDLTAQAKSMTPEADSPEQHRGLLLENTMDLFMQAGDKSVELQTAYLEARNRAMGLEVKAGQEAPYV